MKVKTNVKADGSARSATAFLRVSLMTHTRAQMRHLETAQSVKTACHGQRLHLARDLPDQGWTLNH
jgi:hypothetical protein